MQLYIPTRIIFGRNAVTENKEELKKLGNRAMIVTGKHSSRANGSLADVESALGANGQEWVIFDEIEENPSVETVVRAAKIAIDEKVDFFVAIGGGSPMDASKSISILAKNPEFLDRAEERLYDPAPLDGYPLAAIPTTSGTGSEVTPYSILTLHSKRTKKSIAQKLFAQTAFVDYGYLKTSSREVMINTCTDALAHLLESYLNTNSNEVNRIYSREGMRIWGSVKEQLAGSKEEYTDEMYEKFMHASVLAGMSISHTGTGIPHGLSYPVTYEMGVAHGRAAGYFLTGMLRNYKDEKEVSEVLDLLGFYDLKAFESYMKNLIGTCEIPDEIWERDIRELLSNPAKLKNYPFEVTEEILQDYYPGDR